MKESAIFHSARIEGGLAFPAPEGRGREACFHLLSAASFPRLKKWEHNHVFDPFWRVYWNGRAGNGLIIGNKKIPLEPGQFVVVPAHLLFRTYPGPKAVPHLCLHFAISTHLFLSASTPWRLAADPATLALAKELERVLVRPATANVTYCRQRSLALLHGLFATIFAEHPPWPSDREGIVRVLQALEADPSAFRQPEEMARAANMSARNFHRHFLTAVGQTPGVYLKEVRLREAARRLAGTDQSIEGIAEDLGFSDRFHFSRLFRAFTKSPPAAFRKGRVSGGARGGVRGWGA